MKKLLAGMAAVAMFASCSQNEEFEKVDQKAEISFNSVINKSTRAAIIENDNFSTFTVSGYQTTAKIDAETQFTGGFMDDVVVTKNADTGVWGHAGSFYWPNSNYVSFFATSPAQNLDITAKGYPTFSYTVGDIANQVDLLAANLIEQTKTDAAVQLIFNHLLTQVNFSIKGDTKGYDYVVSKLEITGVDNTGTFTFDGTGTAGGWKTDEKAAGTYTATYAAGSEIKLADVAEDLSTIAKFDNDAKASLFMLLPQTLTASAKVSITYYAAPAGKTADSDKSFTGTKTIELGTTTKWEANKKVRYTLVLSSDAKPIKMGAPTVTPWDTTEANAEEIKPTGPATPPAA